MKKFGMYFIFLCMINNVNADEWFLAQDIDNIQVYTRSVEGSDIREFKAEAVIDAPIRKLLSIFVDFEHYPDWFHETSKAKLLKQVSRYERFSYQNLIMPFPLDDRDLLIHSVLSTKDNVVTLKTNASPNLCNELDDIVCEDVLDSANILVEQLRGEHRFIVLSENQVKIVWQQHIEPKGSVPAWMVNQTLIDVPFYTLSKLRKQVLLERYQDVKLADLK